MKMGIERALQACARSQLLLQQLLRVQLAGDVMLCRATCQRRLLRTVAHSCILTTASELRCAQGLGFRGHPKAHAAAGAMSRFCAPLSRWASAGYTQAAFGAQLRGVEQVDTVDSRATVAAVNAHLDQLRAAIKSYGGTVQARLTCLGKLVDDICTGTSSACIFAIADPQQTHADRRKFLAGAGGGGWCVQGQLPGPCTDRHGNPGSHQGQVS